MKSRIISLSEKGLNLNTFNDNSECISTKSYIYKPNFVLYTTENEIVHFDLSQDKIIYSYKLDNVKNMKTCDCGKQFCVLTLDKKLYLLCDKKVTLLENNIDNADIVCDNIVYVRGGVITIKHLSNYINEGLELVPENKETEKILDESSDIKASTFTYKNDKVKDFIVTGNAIFFSTRKIPSENQKIVCVNTALQIIKDFEYENIEKFTVKNSKDKKYFLLAVTTEYSKESYFGRMKLYFYDSKTLKEVTIQQPLLYFNFIDKGFILCYGPQPSTVVVMNYSLTVKKKFPSGIRNFAYLNNHGNLIGFTGFGNLSGEVEIYSNKLLCKLKVLGASVFNWSPCGSYFLVAVTNELKVDNKITVYDFFGRVIKEMKYDNLESCIWIGDKQPFEKLSQPEKLNVIKEEAYIPPHLRQEQDNTKHKKNNDKKSQRSKEKLKEQVKKKQKEKEEDSNELKLKIDEIASLKLKIQNGEVLSVEEYNKILSEPEIMLKMQNDAKK